MKGYQEENSMISVFEGGAYLINGAEIIPDGAEALSQVKAEN